MIKEQFLYFAQYPSRNGILAMFTNGKSHFESYNTLVAELSQLPQTSRVPEIDNYVYGQSFEELQARIDKCIGSFLFVDYGEMSMTANNHNTYELTQRLAVTVAFKMPNRSSRTHARLRQNTILTIKSTRSHARRCRQRKHRMAIARRTRPSRIRTLRSHRTTLRWLDTNAIVRSPRHPTNTPTIQVLCKKHLIK